MSLQSAKKYRKSLGFLCSQRIFSILMTTEQIAFIQNIIKHFLHQLTTEIK